MKRRMMGWLLAAALLLPGLAMGAEEAAQPLEVVSPGFDYHTLGVEAAEFVTLDYAFAQAVNGYFVLSDGFLSVGYEQVDAFTIARLPDGTPLTCWNSDMSLRWTLADERLDGAWYTALLELPEGLLLGSDRSAPGGEGQVPSLMMLDKATGAIRWQLEGVSGTVWISDVHPDADGNLLVPSNGGLQDEEGGVATLTLLDAATGSTRWTTQYLADYGMERLRSACPLGDGLVLYGMGAQDHVVLYTDAQGAVRAWFTFRPWEDTGSYTGLWLVPVSEDVVYLRGWEMEIALDRHADLPYSSRTLCLMRMDADTFSSDRAWEQ